MALNICGGQGLYLPSTSCDDCAAFEARLERLERRVQALESKLDGLTEISFSKSDGDSTQTGTFLGRVSYG